MGTIRTAVGIVLIILYLGFGFLFGGAAIFSGKWLIYFSLLLGGVFLITYSSSNILRTILFVCFLGASGLFKDMLIDSILRPVDFRETLAERSDAVKEKLTEIAELQKMYKTLKGDSTYAGDFDSLQYAFLKDSFFIQKIEGDPYDTTKVADTINVQFPARDSVINYLAEKGYVDADALSKLQQPALDVMENWSDTSTAVESDPKVSEYLSFCKTEIESFMKEITTVPNSDGKTFSIESGEVAMEGRRAGDRTVPTFEVRVLVGDYMDEYPVSEYAMYDPSYNHGNILKVGDILKSTTSGNW
jgi:hypothetical protein